MNLDPAIFHQQWYRDADAINLVSKYDVEIWHIDRKYKVIQLLPNYSGWRDFIVKRWLTLCIACQKQ